MSEEWHSFTREQEIPEEQEPFHVEKALLAYIEQYRYSIGAKRVYGDLGTPNLQVERLISPLSENGQRPCEDLSDSVLTNWESFLLEYGEPNNTYHTEKALMTYIEYYRRKVSKKIKLTVFRDVGE